VPTLVPVFSNFSCTANSIYAGYWDIGSIHPFPIAIPLRGVLICVVPNMASAEGEQPGHRIVWRANQYVHTNVGYILARKTLSRKVGLFRNDEYSMHFFENNMRTAHIHFFKLGENIVPVLQEFDDISRNLAL
jgi:hypothetical protein